MLSRRYLFSHSAALGLCAPTWTFARPVKPSTIRVGAREVLMDAAERRRQNLTYWPDGNIGWVKRGDTIDTYAANAGKVAKVNHDVKQKSFRVVYAQQAILGLKQNFSYAGGGPVLRQGGRGLLLVYHAERHPGGDARRFYSSLGLARSDDDGANFYDLGEFIRPHVPFNAAETSAIEVGGGTLIEMGGRYVVFFNDREAPASAGQMTRAATAGSPDQLAAWQKFRDGQFSTPALNGDFSPSNLTPAWASVARIQGSNQLVMAYARKRGDAFEIRLASSGDGLDWTDETAVEDGLKEAFYPSIVGFGADEGVVGASFFVYYTGSATGGWQRWQDAALMRRSVTFG